jgi:DNA (cytosine-5)-methyltransferase 3A
MKVLSLFDGMSCGQIALDKLGVKVNKYYASEIDKHAVKVSTVNYPNTIQLGDVTQWRDWDIDWSSIDLLLGGSPCQGFSFAGKQLNFEDERSKLFFVYVDILNHIKSVNPNIKYLLENVNMKDECINVINECLGVESVFINSDSFVQQNRPRLYWCNWDIEEVPVRPEWEGEYWQYRRTYFRKNKSGVCPCLTANMGTGGHNVPLRSPDLKDKLTPEECEALQGVNIGYTAIVSNTQRYKMLGNGWTVDVIMHILRGLD